MARRTCLRVALSVAGSPVLLEASHGEAGNAARAWQRTETRSMARAGSFVPKGYTVPPEKRAAAEQRQLKVYMNSPGLLAEPYRGEPPKLSLLSLLTVDGIRERWKRLVGRAKSVYTLAKCKKDIEGFDLQKFKEEVGEIHEKICTLHAKGDLTELRKYTTPATLAAIKREIKAREAAHWDRIEWTVRQPLKLVQVLQGRLVGLDPKDSSHAFAQLTLRLHSDQKFLVHDKNGKWKAGSPDSDLFVEEYWVLERKLGDPRDRWKLAGRIHPQHAKGG